MKSLFEQNDGTYTEINGYLIPNLTLPKEDNAFIGRYGRPHREYLKKHKKTFIGNFYTQAGLLYTWLK